MPYVFDSIEDQLNGGAQGAAQGTGKSDIFSGGAAPAPGADAGQTAGDKNSVRGIDDAPGSGAGATTGGEKTAQPAPDATPAGANAAFLDKNKAEGSGLATQLKGKLQGNSDALQKEADDYYTTASGAGKAMNFETPNIDKALAGDKDQMGALTSRLSAAAPKVDSYKSTVNVKVPGLDQIQDKAGLTNYLSQTGGDHYTSGQAGLDAMLLGQNSDFVKSRADLLRDQQALSAKQTAYEGDYSTRAQTQAANDFAAGTGAIKGYLGTQESGLDAAAKAQMDAYNARVNDLGAHGDQAYTSAQSADALKALIARAHGADPDLEQYIGQVGDVDPSQYFKAGGAASDINQFYDKGGADKFNMIESLLGGTGVRQAGTAGPQESFDAGGYQDAVNQKAMGLRTTAQAAAAQAKAEADAKAAADQKTADDQKAAADSAAVNAAAPGVTNAMGHAAERDISNPESGTLVDRITKAAQAPVGGQALNPLRSSNAPINKAVNRGLKSLKKW